MIHSRLLHFTFLGPFSHHGPGSRFFQVFPARTTFAHLFGCLRLGHKYGVDYLRRRALGHLSSMFRTTLSEWVATGNSEVEDKGDRLPSSVVTWTFVVESIMLFSLLAKLKLSGSCLALFIAFPKISRSSERKYFMRSSTTVLRQTSASRTNTTS